MKVGLLGAGRIGALHSRLLSEHPDVEQVLVGDVDPAAAERVAGSVGAAAGQIDAVIGGADAAVITAATSAHATLIGLCLDAGLPTFCEKPIALGLEETVEVVERCERDRATLQIGFQRRFDPGFAEARRLVESGELGILYTLRLATHDPEPPHEEYVAHSGGIFRDLHIHDFDALRWMSCREAREVYAAGSVLEFEMFARHGDFDTSAALVTMEDGVLAVLTGGRRDPLGYDVRAELFGSGDSVAVGLDSRTPMRSLEPGAEDLLHGDRHAHFTARFEHAYRAELWHFLDLARGRAENPCTARDALEALRIALAADRSLAEHRPVALDEIG
ncbi:MAG TPA: Gfo/Idh/MocA family oxidoreductase [Thermoleophilaceae bacterium]|nr:Gfo/Idh/MocA family oxidoreductase [Thermoleophilaceae bacterium]